VLTLPRCLPAPTIESPAEWDFPGKQLPDKNRCEWEKNWMDGCLTPLPLRTADKRQLAGMSGDAMHYDIPQFGGYEIPGPGRKNKQRTGTLFVHEPAKGSFDFVRCL
jgi:hypothetical protein